MDREQIREIRNRKIARSLKYVGVVMAIFYLMMAATVAFLPVFEGISIATRYLFASMLSVYGLFRLYRIFKQNQP